MIRFVEWVRCVNVENTEKKIREALKYAKEKTCKMWGVVEMYFMTKRNK